MGASLLVIEDEEAIAQTLQYALVKEGFSVHSVGLAQKGITACRETSPDLILLDVGLPDLSGFEACKEIRKFCTAPIIFLTARSDEIDKIIGLEIGADDYVTKPFSPRELIARIRVILKRATPPLDTPSLSHDIGAFQHQSNLMRISYCGTPLDLTRYEYRLLAHLLSQPNRIFSRDQLLYAAWDAPEACTDRTIDTHIKTIRAKLKTITPTDAPIKTHRGMGYSLEI